MINYPDINPNIISLGPLHLRWYGLAYALGFIIGYMYIKKRFNRFHIKNLIDDAVLYAFLGVIIGGRLGYVIIYNFTYYLHNPIDIFYIWHGGMSFHGGAIGVILAGIIAAKKYKISFYKLADEVAVIVPVGLFFGRIANFINDELWGRVTTVPWAVKFPSGGYLPRHPSQIYEAIFEGLVLFAILRFLRDRYIDKKGFLFYMFILLYGIFRFFIEFTRQPDAQIGFIYGLTMGQWLCISMIIIALAGFLSVKKQWRKNE